MYEDAADFIAHHASDSISHDREYDPVAAREYYLRTRKLKGRKKGRKDEPVKAAPAKDDPASRRARFLERYKDELGKGGKSGKGDDKVAKTQFSERKKRESAAAASKQSQLIAGLQQAANKRREEISNSLKQILETISTKEAEQREIIEKRTRKQLDEVDARLEAQLAALPPLPKAGNRAGSARLRLLRSEKIAKLKGDAVSEKKTIYEKAQVDSKALTESATGFRTLGIKKANADMEEMTTKLRGSIDHAKATYADLRAKLNSKYQAESDARFKTSKDKS